MYRDLIIYSELVQRQYHAYLDRFRRRVSGGFDVSYDYRAANAATLADHILGFVEHEKPFCLIRLGDGEGACLQNIGSEYPELRMAVLARTFGLHFGAQDYGERDAAFWYESVSRAALAADVIACTSPHQAELLLGTPPNDIRGTVGTLSVMDFVMRSKEKIRARLFETWHAHVALLPHYPALLKGRRVHLVTCYAGDFAERVGRAFGCQSVHEINIPGQVLNERGAVAVPLYPLQFDRIAEEVAERVEAGSVCLVGAGLAGKHFCALAASNGAVALDVGSMMDVWYGRGVRPYQSAEFVQKHALEASLEA